MIGPKSNTLFLKVLVQIKGLTKQGIYEKGNSAHLSSATAQLSSAKTAVSNS